ncbi:MAG: type IV secretory system conjugative DNA transfer family protein [Candidatus Thiodiazotropha endolucinida]|nr:type IV secretory system conjugative DNA transfer family protein [Candidatus Thiodiazotropha endolucinida]
MPADQQKAQRPNLLSLMIVTGLLAWGVMETRPLTVNGELQALPGLLAGLAFITGMRLVIEMLGVLARFLDWQATYQPTGKGGTARWARAKDFRSQRSRKKTGPFWGLLAGRKRIPLFIDFASNAMCVAPAGSGKGIYTVVPMGMSIRESKVFPDFKGENVCMLKPPLEKRGEIVRVLNPAGLFKEQIGESDCYNPLDIITDSLHRPGGLRDIPDDLRELTKQLLPEPEQKDGENTYWREGSRRAIADAILLEVMVEEYEATLSSVALLIEDRVALENNLRWVVGVDPEGKPLPDGPMPIESAPWASRHEIADIEAFARLFRARAGNLLALMTGAESRAFDSFITGAQQALAPYAFGRLSPVMQRSTFSMNDLKDGDRPTSLFIVTDASRSEAFKPYQGIMQWCVMTAIKRHPVKERAVYFILDEATNFVVLGLVSLLTWGRSYGLRLLIIFQDFSAYERRNGKDALETLLSETEIKLILPGQRSPKTLAMIEKILGQQSVMSASLSAHAEGLREQVSESGRAMMMADEVRRSPYGLLLVRQLPPALITPVSYAEVHPWRKQVGINPFHGKRFLRPVKLRL